MVVAVYDACVLYPAPLRDFLLHLAAADAVHARWTRHIHQEWIHALLSERPDLTRAQLERTRRLMDANIRECLVENYETLIEQVELPDPDDRHVLAAAIAAKADAIVTFNLADFPDRVLRRHGVSAVHPDAFAATVAEGDMLKVLTGAREHRLNLTRPRKSVDEYLATLELQGLKRTVAALRPHSSFL